MVRTVRSRSAPLLILAVIVVLASSALLILFKCQWGSGDSSVAQPKQSLTSGALGSFSDFLDVGDIYRRIGYPRIRTPPVNVSVEFQYLGDPPFSYTIGYLKARTVSLYEAVRGAAEAAGLDPSCYKLAAASLTRGYVLNGNLTMRPRWILNFVRTYGGFWLWGSYGESSHVEVWVDGLDGEVLKVIRCDEDVPPNSSRFELRVNSSEAVDIARSANLPGLPREASKVVEEGEVKMLDLRIARLGPGARNLYLQNVLDQKYSGKFGLYWVVTFCGRGESTIDRVVLLVSAESGEVAAATYERLYPPTRWMIVFLTPNFTGVEGASVRDMELPVSRELLEELGMERAELIVENVLVLRPGSEGSVHLVIKTLNVEPDLIASLSVGNPLPSTQKIPEGIVFALPGPVLVKGGGTCDVEMKISISPDCPEGTWLIEVDLSTRLADTGGKFVDSKALILLSVWDGRGPWPLPAIILNGLIGGER